MAAWKAAAWVAERATVTVLARTLRVQRQLPGGTWVTLPSLIQSSWASSCWHWRKRARKAAIWAVEKRALGVRLGWVFTISIYTVSWMPHSTPFFSPFRHLLFGKTPLSAIEKTLRAAHSFSLSQYHQAFAAFIPDACFPRAASGAHSRRRLFPALVTFWAFLAQTLERGSSCRSALSRITAWWQAVNPAATPPAADSGGYCAARARLEDAGLTGIATHLARRLEGNLLTEERWHGRHVKLVDGTSASMPDTAANQEAWPQPSIQAPGCGFPVVRLVGLFSGPTGALLHLASGPLQESEIALARRELWPRLEPADVVLSDRGFCSYQDLHAIRAQGADAVVRLHSSRRADFRQGRRLGPDDRLVTWTKPRARPAGCSAEAFAAWPATLSLRLVRYRIEVPGFRTKAVTLVTTLLDPVAFPVADLAELYLQRWQVELHFREIKTLLGLDVLRCLSPAMVRKEIILQHIAYNLVRLLMQQAAHTHHVPLRRISFKGTLDRLEAFEGPLQAFRGQPKRQAQLLATLLEVIARDLLPERPGRAEPRARKRRAKAYVLLTRGRGQKTTRRVYRPRKKIVPAQA